MNRRIHSGRSRADREPSPSIQSALRRTVCLLCTSVALSAMGPASVQAETAGDDSTEVSPQTEQAAAARADALRAFRAEARGQSPGAARSLAEQGPEKDRALLNKAIRLARRIDATPHRGTAQSERLHLARTLSWLARQGPLADRFRSESARLYQRVAKETTVNRERSWAEGELAALYLREGRAPESVQLARRALVSAQSEDDTLAQHRFGLTLASALDRTGDRQGALQLMRKMAALAESLRRDRLGLVPAVGGLDAMAEGDADDPVPWREDFTRSSRLLLGMLLDELPSRDAQQAPPAQSALLEVRDLLETQRSAEIEDYFQDACLREDESAANQARRREAMRGSVLFYPILLPDRVALFVERDGRFEAIRSEIDPKALSAQARQLRQLLEKRTTRQYLRPATALYDTLIRPFGEQLRTEQAKTLVVVPSGALRSIPFSALYDHETKRHLFEILPVAHVPSIRLTRPGSLPLEDLSVLAAGLGVAAGGFQPLAHTRDEINDVSARLPGDVLFDEEFSAANLESALRARPYSIVHVATHGRVENSGAESFLQTHDERLGLERMTSLIQTTRFREDHPLELLTLSACETATGGDRAALGLAGVAVRSGARSALATLWAVDDKATTRLIDRFYAELIKPEQTRAGALREAQLELRRSPGYAHPGYWAPFLMISNWL